MSTSTDAQPLQSSANADMVLGSLDSTTIALNEVESTLRQLLLDVAAFIEQNPISYNSTENSVQLPEDLVQEPLELRFTGGWVRDKLLGIGSHDIDVAINKMTGYQFGLRMKEYLEAPGNAEKYGLGEATKKAGNLSKIEANPEKSKHLETVTTKILGLDIDLVNLRKETYTDDSRNPTMEFGTPEEDALRRDATINAMFYNIRTSQIEDFTCRGLVDLQAGIIRTPLEPFTTFMDDPLRVLRLIRFASRYGYSIEPNVQTAMGDEDIKRALLLKITKERIWTELEKMLRGPDPRKALEYIDQLDLYDTIFVDPTREGVYIPDTTNWKEAYDTREKISKSQGSLHNILIQNVEDEFMTWVVTALLPWMNAPEPPPAKSGKRALPMAANVTREGLKASNKITDLLTVCMWNREEIEDLKDLKTTARDVLGMAIRKWGAMWRLQLMASMLFDVFQQPDHKNSTIITQTSCPFAQLTNVSGIIDQYTRFVTTLKDLDLLDSHTIKPLVDGKTLSTTLSTKPGPWMGPALDVLVAWQFRHPGITDPTSAIEEIKTSNVLSKFHANGARKGTSVGREKNSNGKKQGELTQALLSHFLRQELKPLFAQTTSSRRNEITTAGRKKIDEPLRRRFDDEDPIFDDKKVKPWKYRDTWALDLLAWCCKSLDEKSVEMEWGFLIPPLLTVMDDMDLRVRVRGCEMLTDLLDATPSGLLAKTGLAPLFEENLMVSLSYLPTLTPEDESVVILGVTLRALLSLADCAYPAPPSGQRPNEKRMKFLDKILRHGILRPYAHVSEYVRVVEVLFCYLPSVLEKMGIDSVKHVKDLLPLLANVLAEPLGPTYPNLLLVATKALQFVILNAWPRISFWEGEILKGVTVCWVRVLEDMENRADNENKRVLGEVMDELKVCVEMVRAVMDSEGKAESFQADVKKLVSTDEKLEFLFEKTHIDG
jgi:tRNA nucleotidyltransferase/poly(A) polymerase